MVALKPYPRGQMIFIPNMNGHSDGHGQPVSDRTRALTARRAYLLAEGRIKDAAHSSVFGITATPSIHQSRTIPSLPPASTYLYQVGEN